MQDITILYVDDELFNLKIFEINFKRKFKVITSNSGKDGLQKLKSYPEVSVVISDMRMPEMNGIEFIKQAKQEFPSIVFFILTGFDITTEISDAIEQNLINQYFQKPFNMKEIENAIEEAFNLK